jgi:glycerate kinase
MAAASGLTLVPQTQRDPTRTSTYGTGELIRAALDLQVEQVIVGIGGSATTDCGCGMAQALGVQFYDAQGRLIHRVTGGRMAEVARIDAQHRDPRLERVTVRVACDVDNPLYGPQGAAYIYAPQKGATPEQVAALDAGLRHIAQLIHRDLGIEVANKPGAGAAGGLGAGLMAFCGARLESGVHIVIEAVGLKERVMGADLLITGEGKIDEQTAYGKTPAGAARVGLAAGVPVVAVAGSVPLDLAFLHDVGFTAVFSMMSGPMTLEEAMQPDKARAMLEAVSEQVTRLFWRGVAKAK